MDKKVTKTVFKLFKVFIIFIGFMAVSIASLFIYSSIHFRLKIFNIYELNASTMGRGNCDCWNIVTGNSTKEMNEKDYNIKLPEVDYNKYYLYITSGRKVKSIEYQSAIFWEIVYREYYPGTWASVIWEKEAYNSNKIYAYLTERRELMPPEY